MQEVSGSIPLGSTTRSRERNHPDRSSVRIVSMQEDSRFAGLDDPRVESMVRPLLADLAREVGMNSVFLTEVDWSAPKQSIMYVHSDGQSLVTEGHSFPWSAALCRRALVDGPAYSVDPQGDYPDIEMARELDLQTFISIPVYAGERPPELVGTLCAVSSDVVVLGPETRRKMREVAATMGRNLPRPAATSDPDPADAAEWASLGADLGRAIAVIETQRAELERLAEALAQRERADEGPMGQIGIRAPTDIASGNG